MIFTDAQDKGTLVEEETNQPPPVGLPVQTCWLCTCTLTARQGSGWCLGATSCVGGRQTPVKGLLKMETQFAWVWD